MNAKLSVLGAVVVLPAAVLLAPGAGANPTGPEVDVAPVADASAPIEAMPEPVEALTDAPAELPDVPAELPEPSEALTDVTAVARVSGAALPAGVASERGLQVRTILVERNVSADFPQIHTMIGVRPDSKPWHPNGLALDIMIPNPGSSEGVALGNAIRDFALRNSDRLGIQDVIWRGTYYTPAGPSGSGYGHYDHVHITTTGGGYPGGGEEYPLIDG